LVFLLSTILGAPCALNTTHCITYFVYGAFMNFLICKYRKF